MSKAIASARVRFRVRLAVLLMATIPIQTLHAGSAVFDRPVTVIHELIGEGDGQGFGSVLAHLRDIDGDKVQEIIVAAPFSNAAGALSGRIHVYSGASGLLVPGMQFTGAGPNHHFGYSIADAGDVDGDGLNDVICGAPGPATGPTTLKGRIDIHSGADGTFITGREGEAIGDRFGWAVAGAGDVNRDGFADVLVGATLNDAAAINAGRAYVLSGLDMAILRTWNGETVADRFGGGIAECGDINGDGVPEHVVAAPDAGPSGAGRAYVYDGATGAAFWPGVAFLAPTGVAAQFGEYFVAAAGDVNNDGLPDVYIGDYAASHAYVFSGADGSTLMNLVETPAGGLGCGRFAGDVNGDGYGDLVIGAYFNGDSAPNAGKAYVVSGKDSAVLRTITSTIPQQGFGWDAVGIGDVNSDGAIDYVVGAAGGVMDRAYVIAGDPLPTPCPEDLDGSGVVSANAACSRSIRRNSARKTSLATARSMALISRRCWRRGEAVREGTPPIR
jgi:FG-GAP-like repeat/FG-GAP repeat